MDEQAADMLATAIAQEIGKRKQWPMISMFVLGLFSSAIALAANHVLGTIVLIWWSLTAIYLQA